MTHAQLAASSVFSSQALRCDAVHLAANRRMTEASWYDVFAISEACFVVTVGSVAGADAQALAGAVRAAFGPGDTPLEPKALLTAALAALHHAASGARLATALVGIVDCADRTLRYISAGNPPPFLRFHDGAVAALPVDGHPIDLGEFQRPPAQVVVALDDAASLILYSKMLVHATGDAAGGLARLGSVIGDERFAHCSSPAAWVAHRMLADRSHDDVAILALSFPRVRPRADGPAILPADRPRWTVDWSFDSIGAASLDARRSFLACLESKQRAGVSLDLAAAELIFGELLGNVVRHAPGQVDISLDWTAELPVLHVLDNGPGFRSRRKRERLPVDDWSESGRGLFIVNACAVAFSVRNRSGRGTHASATLPAL
jgi:anti-sigma regulatory factor (Ser/Thr protein kinase)